MLGKYKTRFVWMKYQTSKDNTYGQDKQYFTNYCELWGYVDENSGGLDNQVNKTNGIIYLNGYIPIKATDRLFNKEFGELWMIDSVARGKRQMILQATKQKPRENWCEYHQYQSGGNIQSKGSSPAI